MPVPCRSRRHRVEQPAVVAIPVAAPAAGRIELTLGAQEFGEPRMRRLDLPARRPAMVGEVVAAAVREGEVDERAEAVRCGGKPGSVVAHRSEEHTSELQSLMRISYAVFCLKKKRQI